MSDVIRMPALLGTPEHLELSWLVSSILALYVVTTLTIPFWVPILKRLTGDCGVFWVFSVLTYYAYLAWLIFALLLALLLYRVPLAGLLWLAVVVLRVVQFVRLGSRSPGSLHMSACARGDEEAPLPLATDHDGHSSLAPASLLPSAAAAASIVGCNKGAAACNTSVGPAGGPPSASDGGACSGACGGACGGMCDGTCSSGSSPEAIGLGRVLLVGNGPSIRERGMGSDIDGFDTVVRFNSFVTKGLEEHTGSKTSLWCHMMQWYHISTVEVCAPAPFQNPEGASPSLLSSSSSSSSSSPLCPFAGFEQPLRPPLRSPPPRLLSASHPQPPLPCALADRPKGGVAADQLRVEPRGPRSPRLRAQLPDADAAAFGGHHVVRGDLLARAPRAGPAAPPGAHHGLRHDHAAARVRPSDTRHRL